MCLKVVDTRRDDNTVHEGMIPVLVCCTPEVLDLILDMALTHYNQQEAFAFKISDEVRIKRAPGKLSPN